MTGTELMAAYTASTATTQMSNYLAYKKKTVDLFAMPLDTAGDLTAITKAYRYVGMKMKVLNTDTDNIMTEYWWDGKEWKLVEQGKDFTDEINQVSIERESGDTFLQEEIVDLAEKIANLQIASSTTINTTSASTTVYIYIDKDTGEEKTTEDEEEAIDHAASGYTTTTVETKTEVITNTYLQNINIDDMDTEFSL